MNSKKYKFPEAVCDKIGYYVYYLVNPINGKVFYVGKGKRNRIFQHIKGITKGNASSEKITTIKQILRKNRQVKYVIIRHGLTEKEAFEVESSLIDHFGLTGLTNKVYGHDSEDRGKMSPEDIVAVYDAQRVKIHDPVILININNQFRRNMTQQELYNATRSSWKLGKRRYKAKYALPTYRGIIREVYEIKSWHPKKAKSGTRWEFKGNIANERVRKKYLSKSINRYLRKGAQNPIKYIKC